jgi:hypothetical protein
MARFRLERRFIFSKTGIGLFSIICIIFALAANCGKTDQPEAGKSSDWEYAEANYEYRLLQYELNLAQTGQPYLGLDFFKNNIVLKLKGATVWDYPLSLTDADSAEIKAFIKSFIGEKANPLRPVKNKYLFKAADKTSDSVLQIVGEVVNVNPELLQRELPEQFQIAWSGELKIVVNTDITGKPISAFKNVLVKITDVLDSPLGEKTIELKMEPAEALTLYRAVEKGMPTLLFAKFKE